MLTERLRKKLVCVNITIGNCKIDIYQNIRAYKVFLK